MGRKAAPIFTIIYPVVNIVLPVLLFIIVRIFYVYAAFPFDNPLIMGLVPLFFCFFGLFFTEAMCEDSPAKKKAALFLNILNTLFCVLNLIYLISFTYTTGEMENEMFLPVYKGISILLTIWLLGTFFMTIIGISASVKLGKNKN